MNPLTQTQLLDCRVSRIECTAVFVSHTVALGVVVGLALARPVWAFMVVPIAGSAVYCARMAGHRGRRAIRQLRLAPDGRCVWQTCDDSTHQGRVTAIAVYGAQLVSLRLQCETPVRRRLTTLTLFADSLPPDTHRRLRVWSRVQRHRLT